MVTIFRYVKWPETPGKIILVHQFHLQSPKNIVPSAKAKVRISDRKYLLPSPPLCAHSGNRAMQLGRESQRGSWPSQQWEGGRLAAEAGKPRLGGWLTPLLGADITPGPQGPSWFSGAQATGQGFSTFNLFLRVLGHCSSVPHLPEVFLLHHFTPGRSTVRHP